MLNKSSITVNKAHANNVNQPITSPLITRFLAIKRISLLVLLVAVVLLLGFILWNLCVGNIGGEFSLLLPLIALPLAFIIIRLIYRRLKDTDMPFYVVTLVSILPVVGAIYLDDTFGNHQGFDFAVIADIFIASAVFSFALLLTSLGHLFYQILLIKHTHKCSALMLVSAAVAAVIIALAVIMTVQKMTELVSSIDDLSIDVFLNIFYFAIFDYIIIPFAHFIHS